MHTRATVRLPFILLLVAVLHSTFPILPASATPGGVPTQAVGRTQEPPPTPEVRTYQPSSDPILPGLALEVQTTPESVSIGDALTVRLTVTNRSEHPAEDVVLTLPLPPGVRADKTATQSTFTVTPLPQPVSEITTPLEFKAPVLPDPVDSDQAHSDGDDQLSPRSATSTSAEVVPPVLPADKGATRAAIPADPGVTSDQVAKLPIAVPPAVDPGRDLQWSLPKLEGTSVAMLEVTLVLNAPQPDGAVVFEPWATARDLLEPARATGGTLVIDAAHTPISSRVEPGTRASVRSADGRVTVEFPPRAADRALTLRYARLADDADALRARGSAVPERGLFGRPSLDAFTLTATDDSGRDLHQFKESLNLSVSYTEAQLRARGLRESDLTLAWFDESEKRWQPVPTTIDSVAHTATAAIDHFSVWTLADGLSPSATFVPSLQGFQASDFTGAATYQVPMDVPAGPAGIKPNLGLNYSSATSDGTNGLRERWQASWVGKGWNLNAGGSVARVRSPVGEFWDHFSFSLGGRSYDIVRGEQLSGTPGDMTPTLWSWVAVDEADFLKVRAVDAGGVIVWVAWTKDGSRYDFTEELYTTDTDNRYIYQWLLNRVTDSHGNRIDYQYSVDTVQQGDLFQPTYYLKYIYWGYDGGMGIDNWGHPVVQGTPRYQIEFKVGSRWETPVDTLWDYPVNWQAVVPHEAYRLKQIDINSWGPSASGYERIRSYVLEYYSDTQSVWADSSAGQRVLTLRRVAQVGRDGGQLPWTTFTYRMDMGAWPYNPGWNRLVTVNNGQGGQVQVIYGKSFGSSTLNEEANYHRVAELWRQDISNQAYSRSNVTTYEYPTAALNDKQYSLKVWFAEFPPGGYGNSKSILAHAERREFRGHAWMRSQDYDVTTNGLVRLRMAETFFYQGSAGCTPTVTGGVIDLTTTCYDAMARQELWKGKPYLVRTYDGNGSLLRQNETIYNYQILPFFGLNDYTGSTGYPRTGLWRQFTPARITREGFNEGATTPTLGKTTAYCYQPNWLQKAAQYGNVTHVLEWDQLVTIDYATQLDINPNTSADRCDTPNTSVAPVRITRTAYNVVNTTNSYIADRPNQKAIYGANASQLLSLNEYFYQGYLTTTGAMGTDGRLGLTRAYRNMSETPTMYSQDISYGYDAWGNRTSETTYAGWGTRTGTVYSSAGNGSTARTTTSVYDSTFHAFPIQSSNALGHPPESAGYDYRMGTLTSITDANNVVTSAEYDQFGRMVKLIKPGDSSTYPTLRAYYYDFETPFRYLIERRETAGSSGTTRPTTRLYDGLGRMVQTKDSYLNIVTDYDYDGLGRVRAQSQPRYVTESGTPFWLYTTPSNPLYRVTTTTYDSLGRVVTTTAPDLSQTAYYYGIVTDGYSVGTRAYEQVVDTNRHITQRRTDALGRLREVLEISGDCGISIYTCGGNYTTAYAVYGTTTYSYDPRDQLIQTLDAHQNIASISYDALGRKRTMTDLDMGSWSYGYDPNGNLTSQTDARSITTSFSYDALNRLTSKSFSDGTPTYGYGYDSTLTPYGIGRRSAVCGYYNGSICELSEGWNYDARGRVIWQGQLGGIGRNVQWTYDSADRVQTMTYPDGEQLTYGYDAAWRPSVLSSSLGGYYVSNATYTALDQPLQRTIGTEIETWDYSTPLARLSRLRVGTAANLGSMLDRTYGYDPVGNITSITDPLAQNQSYTYDHRDRLRSWTLGSTTENYTYDLIGNLTQKGAVALYYGYGFNGTGYGPHQARNVNGLSYAYDGNGNLVGGQSGRGYLWNADNRATVIESGGVTETYRYDPEGARISRTRLGVTTKYMPGLLEEVVGGVTTKLISFNGQVIAKRDGAAQPIFLYGDHLGSVSLTTVGNGLAGPAQRFDPWGKVIAGGITQTKRNYTGQYLDDTGLLYYNARYYDPNIGRFVSADKIVQDTTNPQALNRYSYVLNNPIRYTDPSGHCIPGIGDCKYTGEINWHDGAEFLTGAAEGAGAVVAGLFEPLPIAEALSDPEAFVQGIQSQGEALGRGLEYVINDPAGAAATLNNDPRGVGRILGEAAATAALTKLDPGACSFSADTPVRTDEGQEPIGDIEVGDTVLAYHEGLDTTGVYTVTAVWAHRDPQIVILTIDQEQIETTPEHPFFVVGLGWTPAIELTLGNEIQRADGTSGEVRSQHVEQRSQVMYNFTVAEAHTYFVGEGGWLVHNSCGPISMDNAVERAVSHAGPRGVMETTGGGRNFQFRSTTTTAAGNVESRMGRLDVNPADPHVQRDGPHLNIETQINGRQISNEHIPIDPSTIRRGDYPH